jgi:hypothetical protein
MVKNSMGGVRSDTVRLRFGGCCGHWPRSEHEESVNKGPAGHPGRALLAMPEDQDPDGRTIWQLVGVLDT